MSAVRVRYWPAALFCVALTSLPAHAHSPGASPIHPVLDPLPANWSQLTVQVAQTLAPQLLIENRSARSLEILDTQGRAFLRIGPAGVEADLAAAAWYQTYASGGVPVPEAARDPAAPPNWRVVRREPAWGWFDPRLLVASIKVSDKLADAGRPATIGTWSVPVIWGSEPAQIHGHFEFRPAPRGVYRAALNLPADFPPDISLRVIQGGTPAILLQNQGAQLVTVLGLDGEPYLRIGAAGVEVNLRSETWRRYGRESRGVGSVDSQDESSNARPGEVRAAESTADSVRWQRISSRPNYAWLEPRASVDQAAADAAEHPTRHWQIPLRIGAQACTLEGFSEWRAIDSSARH